MPTIITIGHQHFLAKSTNAAMALIKALEGSMPMEREYCGRTHEDIYRPSTRKHDTSIKMEVVTDGQIQMPKPPRKPQTERLLEPRREPPVDFGS
jgi:hypothetical protein